MDDLCLKMENIVAKGEIFKKLSAAEASESVYMRERVNSLLSKPRVLRDYLAVVQSDHR